MTEIEQPAWGVRLKRPSGTLATTDAFGVGVPNPPTAVLVAAYMVNASPLTGASLGRVDTGLITSSMVIPSHCAFGILEDQAGIAIDGSALASEKAIGAWPNALSFLRHHRALTLADARDWLGTAVPEQSATAEAGLPLSMAFSPEILALFALPDNWNGVGSPAPNAIAASKAQRIVAELTGLQLASRRIVASAEGGIAIAFSQGRKYADIETLNSGTVLAVMSGDGLEPEVWEVGPDEIVETLRKIGDFIRT